jgi:hypothetical protein
MIWAVSSPVGSVIWPYGGAVSLVVVGDVEAQPGLPVHQLTEPVRLVLG